MLDIVKKTNYQSKILINSDIVFLNSSEIEQATEILVEAFREDPMFRYLGTEVEQELQINSNALEYFCKMSLQNCQPYHHIYTTANNLKGVAVWIPPGKSEMNAWQFLSMLLVLPGKCGWHKTGRCLSLLSALNKRHQKEMTEPHWNLSLLGVAPAYRGQGIGSLLLQPVLKLADRECFPCYLSTFNQQAISFYQKHKFTVLWQGKLSDLTG